MRGLSFTVRAGAWRCLGFWWLMSHAAFLLSIHRFGTGDFISTTMKNEQFPEGLLHEPIASLKFSDEFKEVVSNAGYGTLAEMLARKNPYKLLKHPGFGYRMLAEYFTFLVDNKMNYYLQPR